MSTKLDTLLNEDEDRILPLLRLAHWASEASPAIDQLTFLRDHAPGFRATLDPLTEGMTFPDVRNAGQLVAGVLAVAIDLLESRGACAEGGAA